MCTKTGLIKTLKHYYTANEESRKFFLINFSFTTLQLGSARYGIWDTTPTSFILTAGNEDTEFSTFVNRVKDLARKSFHKESLPAKHCLENMWLVKPENLNQGKFASNR